MKLTPEEVAAIRKSCEGNEYMYGDVVQLCDDLTNARAEIFSLRYERARIGETLLDFAKNWDCDDVALIAEPKETPPMRVDYGSLYAACMSDLNRLEAERDAFKKRLDRAVRVVDAAREVNRLPLGTGNTIDELATALREYDTAEAKEPT